MFQIEDAKKALEETHVQQIEEIKISLQREHETKLSDLQSQHQMEVQSVREITGEETKTRLEVCRKLTT